MGMALDQYSAKDGKQDCQHCKYYYYTEYGPAETPDCSVIHAITENS